jgi:hypothetical protein
MGNIITDNLPFFTMPWELALNAGMCRFTFHATLIGTMVKWWFVLAILHRNLGICVTHQLSNRGQQFHSSADENAYLHINRSILCFHISEVEAKFHSSHFKIFWKLQYTKCKFAVLGMLFKMLFPVRKCWGSSLVIKTYMINSPLSKHYEAANFHKFSQELKDPITAITY